MQKLPPAKLIVILGPTASGKSALAVKLARKFGGEVVSADSRQVYKGLDVGTGKITKREMRGIPHHLLDMRDPRTQLSVAGFKRAAISAIESIRQKNKLPFLVGGTGLYIDAVARGMEFPDVPPNLQLRSALKNNSAAELHRLLQRLDPKRAAAIDSKNPRRLIRAIEIIKATRRPMPPVAVHPPFRALFLGIRRNDKELRARIRKACAYRVRCGLISETKRLAKKIGKKRLAELGLDYKVAADAVEARYSKLEFLQKLEAANWHYARRQKMWFKRHKDIRWIESEREAAALIRTFLGSNQKTKAGKR